MQIFYSDHDGRGIYLEIKDGHAIFYLESRIKYFNERKKWLEDNNIEQDDDEPKEPESFYDIPLNQWNNIKYNWKEHMIEKNWFTEEMSNFLDKQNK